MSLRIETFNNASGGNAFFKAVTHPLAARRWAELRRRLGDEAVAIYDPDGQADALAELYDLRGLKLAGSFVQDVSHVGRAVLGLPAQPVTELPACRAKFVLAIAFDAARLVAHIQHLVPQGAEVETLDALRIPDALLSNRARYLDPLNFATNFVFFREADGLSTRLVTANYWMGYGAPAAALWCLLFDGAGGTLAEWREELPPGMSAIVLDSRAVRRALRLARIYRAAVPARDRRRGPRRGEIRARHRGRRGQSIAFGNARRQFLAGRFLCRAARASRQARA